MCGEREATLFDRTVVNNHIAEYAFCEACYKTVLKSGLTPHRVMAEKLAKQGKVCPECGWTAEDFGNTFLMGCPECYKHLRGIAADCALRTQGSTVHIGKGADAMSRRDGEGGR